MSKLSCSLVLLPPPLLDLKQFFFFFQNVQTFLFSRTILTHKCFIFAGTVKPDLTTTCEQRPPVDSGQFASSTTSLNLSFIRHLCQTATFFRSQGWPLYTGLTVFSIWVLGNIFNLIVLIVKRDSMDIKEIVKGFKMEEHLI